MASIESRPQCVKREDCCYLHHLSIDQWKIQIYMCVCVFVRINSARQELERRQMLGLNQPLTIQFSHIIIIVEWTPKETLVFKHALSQNCHQSEMISLRVSEAHFEIVCRFFLVNSQESNSAILFPQLCLAIVLKVWKYIACSSWRNTGRIWVISNSGNVWLNFRLI